MWAGPQPLLFYHPLTGVPANGGVFVPDVGGVATVSLQGCGGSFIWDGRNSSGQFVAGGVYTMEFSASAPSAPSVNYTDQVSVLRVADQNGMAIYNSAGELVRHFQIPQGAPSYLQFSAGGFVPASGSAGVRISWGTGPSDSAQWNGFNDSGTLVSPGVYLVVLTTQAAGQAPSKFEGSLQVLAVPSDLLRGALAAPNPMRREDRTLKVFTPALQSGDTVRARLYRLDGSLLAQTAGTGSGLSLALPDSLAGGVYLLNLEAFSPSTGKSQNTTLKLAVLR